MELLMPMVIAMMSIAALTFLLMSADEGPDVKASQDKTEITLNYVTEIKAFSESDARTEFIDYVAKATEDDIITNAEYYRIENLATAARIADKTSDIKSLTKKE